MEKPAQNIQDSFLNTARKEKLLVTIYLLGGVKLTGRIRSFDKYCLVLESSTQEQMVFKHAISTLCMPRSVARDAPPRRPLAVAPRPAGLEPAPTAAPAEDTPLTAAPASGTA